MRESKARRRRSHGPQRPGEGENLARSRSSMRVKRSCRVGPGRPFSLRSVAKMAKSLHLVYIHFEIAHCPPCWRCWRAFRRAVASEPLAGKTRSKQARCVGALFGRPFASVRFGLEEPGHIQGPVRRPWSSQGSRSAPLQHLGPVLRGVQLTIRAIPARAGVFSASPTPVTALWSGVCNCGDLAV